jgi:hypothetical protein
MYLSWPVTQEEYLNRLIYNFGYFPESEDHHTHDYVPSVVYISAKFVTCDVTNRNCVEDPFQVKIFSSGEGFGSLCSYDNLSLASPSNMDEDLVLEYTVKSEEKNEESKAGS